MPHSSQAYMLLTAKRKTQNFANTILGSAKSRTGEREAQAALAKYPSRHAAADSLTTAVTKGSSNHEGENGAEWTKPLTP